MKTLLSSFWFAAAAIVYVGFAALEASPRPWLTWLVMLSALVVLWLTWRYTGTSRTVPVPENLVLTNAKRAAVSASLLLLCSRTGPVGHSGFDVAANLSVGISVVAACVALANISGRGGLLSPPRAARSRDAAIMAALLWGIATTLPAVRALVPTTILLLDPIAIDYATVTAAMASLLLLLAVTTRLTYLRRLELGVADRATSTLTVALVALLATVPALMLDVAAPDRAVPFVVSCTCLFYVWAATAGDPRRITASLRVILAILAFLAPVVLLLAILARKSPLDAPLYVVLAGGLSALLGLLASRLARPLAPEQSRWLEAISDAAESALEPDPEDALRATLMALKPIAPGASARVELWQVDPPKLLYVDIAGQLHEEAAELPPSVIALAQNEPERTLRSDVLGSAQVRNVSAREALAYFGTHKTYSATLLTHETEPLGLLALPQTHRTTPLSLEECIALRRLCDRIESVLSITSAQARARERELQGHNRVAELERENRHLSASLTGTLTSCRRVAEAHAQRLLPVTYSSRSRQIQQELERWGQSREALVLLVPAGIEPLPWVSVYHLASARRQGPYVTYDATRSDFAQEAWEDPERSPIAEARGGTWILQSPETLSLENQEVLARALHAFRVNPTGDPALALGVALVLHSEQRANYERLPLVDALRTLVPVEGVWRIPSLAERPEDLRASIYEQTARLGIRFKGKPLGVSPSALAEMLEYDWPLNDCELSATLAALVQVAEGDSVTDSDLDHIAFRPLQQRAHAPRAAEEPLPRRRPRPAPQTFRPRDR